MEEGSVLRHQPLSESNTYRGAFQVDIWALCICLSQSQNGESMFLTCQNYIFEKYIHRFLSRNFFERCIISNFIACFRIMIYVNTIKPSWFVTCNGVGLDVWWWIFTQYSWNTRTGRGGYLPHQRNPVTGGPYQTGPSLPHMNLFFHGQNHDNNISLEGNYFLLLATLLRVKVVSPYALLLYDGNTMKFELRISPRETISS